MNDLTCPITLDIFEDPVSVPCCGKSFSRMPLCQHLQTRHYCPNCRGNLANFDVLNCQRNRVLADMIENYRVNEKKIQLKNGIWTIDAFELPGQISGDNDQKIHQLSLRVKKSKITTKPTLLVLILDKSGSMAGNPWNQVQTAVTHILCLSKTLYTVKTKVIVYDSSARLLNVGGTEEQIKNTINSISAGGGTNFRSAFACLDELLEDELENNDLDNVSICFMTDGQDWSSPDGLVEELRTILSDSEDKTTTTVHTVGFSHSCATNLLEEMRCTGSVEGTFRFASPQDSEDTLCQKLQGLFDIVSKSSTVPLEISGIQLKGRDEWIDKMEIQMPINNGRGSWSGWCKLDNKQKQQLQIEFPDGNTESVEIKHVQLTKRDILGEWYKILIEEMACRIMKLNQQSFSNAVFKEFACVLVQQALDNIVEKISRDGIEKHKQLIQNFEFFTEQVINIRKGNSVDMGKLGDLRFASLFNEIKGVETSVNLPARIKAGQNLVQIDEKRYYQEYCVKYNRNKRLNKDRTDLQKEIMAWQSDRILPTTIENMIMDEDLDELLLKDEDGNTVIHMAAYCGHSTILRLIISRLKETISDGEILIYLTDQNNDGETPVSLAIKGRGFINTLNVLFNSGATIPEHRKESLQKWAYEQGYLRTVDLLQAMGSTVSKTADDSMNPNFLKFMYKKAKKDGIEIDVQSYFEVALQKLIYDLIKEIIDDTSNNNFENGNTNKDNSLAITIDLLNKWCVPKKPDVSNVDEYLEIIKLMVEQRPELIYEKDMENGNTGLIQASDGGNLPIVKYFLDQGAKIDAKNELGNTALWVSCKNGWPCIIDELLNRGADPNAQNIKGNPPLYALCQKGHVKPLERMIMAGANAEHMNIHGDTLVLTCCRSGHSVVLESLLNYVSKDFINFKADIDGFNGMFASVESNRPECIRVLNKWGISVNQFTDDDNEIIQGATPLHLAAYYGCLESASTLIELGANLDEANLGGLTPMHMAVLQGNLSIVKLLKNAGADLTKEDQNGNSIINYARNNVDILNILVDPVAAILVEFAKDTWMISNNVNNIGNSNGVEWCQKDFYDILRNYGGIPGLLLLGDVLGAVDENGHNALFYSVLYGNKKMVEVLVNMGVRLRRDGFKLPINVWTNWLGNKAILELVESHCDYNKICEYSQQCLDRLKMACNGSMDIKQLLFLGKCSNGIKLMNSGLHERMKLFLQPHKITQFTETLEDKKEYGEKLIDNDETTTDESHGSIIGNNNGYNDGKIDTGAIIKKVIERDSTMGNQVIWLSKVHTIATVARGGVSLNPKEIFAISLYTNNSILCSSFGDPVLKPCFNYLYNVVRNMEEYHGEVFMGLRDVDRSEWKEGTVHEFEHMVSGSSVWKVATENMPEFFTKKKRRGTIFVIKSRTGRLINNLSQFSTDYEVVFLPGTRFRVKAWYKGTVIALGQKNIRDTTFELTDEELLIMENTDNGLIIYMEEC